MASFSLNLNELNDLIPNYMNNGSCQIITETKRIIFGYEIFNDKLHCKHFKQVNRLPIPYKDLICLSKLRKNMIEKKIVNANKEKKTYTTQSQTAISIFDDDTYFNEEIQSECKKNDDIDLLRENLTKNYLKKILNQLQQIYNVLNKSSKSSYRFKCSLYISRIQRLEKRISVLEKEAKVSVENIGTQYDFVGEEQCDFDLTSASKITNRNDASKKNSFLRNLCCVRK